MKKIFTVFLQTNPSSLRGTKQSGLLKKIAAVTLWLRNDGNIILAMTVVAGLYLFLGISQAFAATATWTNGGNVL